MRLRGRRFGQAAPGRLALCMAALAVLGGLAGWLAKWLDFNTQALGNMLSELAVWMLMGLLIARFSGSPGRSAAYGFMFFASMIVAYYLAAEGMGGVYGMAFAYGWAVVACLSPLAAFAAWYAFGQGWSAWALSVGITVMVALSSPVIFRSFHLRDILLTAACAVLLFRGKLRKAKP